MLAQISSYQLSEWQVFTSRFQALPDGPREAGVIAAQVTRIWSGGRCEPQDFIPVRPMPRPEQSPEAGIAILRALGAAQLDRTTH